VLPRQLLHCLYSNTETIDMRFTWVRITVDQVVSPNPTKIGSVIITPVNDSKKTYVSLYDGESTSDPKLITIRTLTGATKKVNFTPYLETQRGLYVDVGGDRGEVLVQLMWEAE